LDFISWETIKDITKKAIAYAQAGDRTGAQDYYLKNGISKQADFQTLLRELGTFNVTDTKTQADSENNTIAFVKMILLLLPIGVIIVAVFVGIVITRMITVPINEVVANIKEIADGNLTIKDLALDSKDEIGVLAKSLNIMSSNVKYLITQVATSAEQLASSSEELTASAKQQAQATNQVALAIQQVATGTEKLVL